MKYKSSVGSFGTLAAIVFICLIGIGGLMSDVQAKQANSQEQGKVVKLAYSHKPIIKISELKASGKTRNFGENFDDENWLKNLSFKLENNSGKRIVYLQININFPETRATGNMMSFPIVFGRFPDIENRSKNPPLLLQPHGALEVTLSDEYDKLAKFINGRTPIEFMRQAELEIGFVIFDDKMAWAGDYLRQNPNNPKSYIPIETKTQNE